MDGDVGQYDGSHINVSVLPFLAVPQLREAQSFVIDFFFLRPFPSRLVFTLRQLLLLIPLGVCWMEE